MKLQILRSTKGLVAGCVASLGLVVAPSIGFAADFDGSHTLLCAPTTLLDCQPDGSCARSTHAQMDIPTFIEIDFKHKRLSGRTGQGASRTSAVQNVRKIDGRTILQGGENGRGWSVDIDQATGNFSAAIAGNDVGFVLFGACTPK